VDFARNVAADDRWELLHEDPVVLLVPIDGLMAMAAFLTMISPGPAVGIGAGPTSRGVLACLSQAAWLFGVDMLVD
jgi:hypothetical protein